MTIIEFFFRSIRRIWRPLVHIYYYCATWISFKANGVSISTFQSRGIPLVLVPRKGKMIVGKNLRMNNGYDANQIGFATPCTFLAEEGATITIGSDVGMSQTSIYAVQGGDITIGSHVLMGGGVKIYGTDFHSLKYMDRRESLIDHAQRKCAPVSIGDDCFIGAGTTILCGVRIGERSIIGASSVVTKDIPSDELWAGNPAKFIRKL